MSSWRPDGWDAEDIYATTEWIGMKQTDLVEAGADAMLEVLRASGKKDIAPIHLLDWVMTLPAGTLVFIPDDAKPTNQTT